MVGCLVDAATPVPPLPQTPPPPPRDPATIKPPVRGWGFSRKPSSGLLERSDSLSPSPSVLACPGSLFFFPQKWNPSPNSLYLAQPALPRYSVGSESPSNLVVGSETHLGISKASGSSDGVSWRREVELRTRTHQRHLAANGPQICSPEQDS